MNDRDTKLGVNSMTSGDNQAQRGDLVAALQAFVSSDASDDSWTRLVEAMVAERDARVANEALWDERDRQVAQWEQDLGIRRSQSGERS